jgi:predicted DNA-binding transcriptional regulator YafY
MSTSPQRQLRILQLLPRAPRKITVDALAARLVGEGIVVHTRTVRRDLEELSRAHSLVCDDRMKPHGWAWAKAAEPLLPPTLDPQTALAFTLLAEHAAPLLPATTLTHLKPYFDQAARVVTHGAGPALKRWPSKIRILPHGIALDPCPVDEHVQGIVYRAVFEERRFRATYRNTSQTTKEHVVNPLALVLRGAQRYLVCTLKRPEAPTQLALSRILTAEILDDAAAVPADFDLDAFIRAGNLNVPLEAGMVSLVFRVRSEVGGFLRDTRLSADQRIVDTLDTSPHGPAWMTIEATVPSTRELLRWLLGFGSDLEVIAPRALREELAARVRESARAYAET